MLFANLVWDPDRNVFVVPYINHPITWYGVLFATGFLVGYFLMRRILAKHFNDELTGIKLTDRLTTLVVLGTIIGARLGHVFFYGWPYYKHNPVAIFKIWEGGLASHGGALGVLLGILIFVWWNRQEKLSFMVVLDALVIPAGFVAGCIRIGNFMNQEITGLPTDQPWGIIFKHPLGGIPDVPIHPVMLYESFTYFAIFIFLVLLWRARPARLGLGLFSGWFFTLVFGARFVLEFLKVRQSEWLEPSFPLSMGQLLSLPFILLGISLLIWYTTRAKDAKS